MITQEQEPTEADALRLFEEYGPERLSVQAIAVLGRMAKRGRKVTEAQIDAGIRVAEDALLEWYRISAEDRHKTPLPRFQMRAVLEAIEKDRR